MEGSALQLENRTQVIVWLRENYKHATTTSVSKRSVFGHYLEACQNHGVLTPISHTYFGKLVRKAFPDVRCNRKGPRGSAQQHYRLLRVDGGDSSAFMAAHMGDEDEEDVEEEDEEEYVRRRPVKRNIAKAKAATSAAALRKNGPSRVRAAATAAASTISRMISADQQASSTAHLTEAWSFSSAPSSPVYSSTLSSACQSTTASIPSSPAQSSSEDDEAEEEYEEEAVEEEEVVEEESGELINFELPQFEITPGEESPGTSFSYEACPAISGHEQNLILQQQLQLQQQQQQQCQQSYFEPAAFYDFVSPDLEMPLSAINQVNLVEDFGWNMAPTSAVYHQQQQQQAYHQQQQQQQYYYQQSFLADQLPAAQCSDLVEWVEHYCN